MNFNITFNQSITTPIFTDPQSIISNIKPLALLAIGVVIYAIFIFKFYKYLAKRDIIKANWNDKYAWTEGTTEKISKILFYTLEYIIFVPVIIFFWFLCMALILLVVSNNTAAQIMLISMAIISGVRIISYYNEELAKDVAKLMPLTLIAVFVSDISFFSMDSVLNNALNMFSLTDKLVFYLLFAAMVEFIMRVIQLIRNSIRKQRGIENAQKRKDSRNEIIEIN